MITEVTHLFGTRLGAEAEVRFLGDLAAGNLIAELVAQYQDLPLGTADASVIAASERLPAPQIATLDRRHFGVVQSQLGALTLLP